MPHPSKVVTSAVLLLVFSLCASVPASGQVVLGRGGNGRRVGRIVLPTPPYNPDAGVINSPKTRRTTSTDAAPRRTAKRSAKSVKRNPRRATPRKRRMGRSKQRP
ncbi:MAG TPA: hypothetical protein VF666_03470 [Pyrinomonadaceae bacterium]